MLQSLTPYARRIPVWLVYLVGFLPGIWVWYAAFNNKLGADPLAVLEHETGIWALRYLIAALAITPLLRLTRLNLIKFRRAFGLLAFYFVIMHLVAWVWLDRGLDWSAMWTEIVKRPYITIGMAAFVMLVPLALTSNTFAIHRLSALAWRRIHWWAYPATLLGAVHFILVVKRWPPEPMIYLGIVTLLLAWRAWTPLQKRLRNREERSLA